MKLLISSVVAFVLVANITAVIVVNAQIASIGRAQAELFEEHRALREAVHQIEQDMNALGTNTAEMKERLSWVHDALRIDKWTQLVPIARASKQ